ncbi:MAG: hypothetical protein ABI569_05980 [Casimicrobiaceae bacterium]
MNPVLRSCALAACVLSSSIAFAASPQRTFVASTGNDANPCTLIAPCRGFQAAIDAVAAGGEVVVADSAGYGAMEIHKSVSVIVPQGVHAGLSPAVGIPLPGFPGQSTVVLIDITVFDTVVLRGLNVNHQGAVTGGIDWLSANGGTVHVENTIVNGFPNEGLLAAAPGGRLYVKDSIFRNNGFGIYVRGTTSNTRLYADRVRIENSTKGVTAENNVTATIRDSVISGNDTGVFTSNVTVSTDVTLDHCAISNNNTAFSLNFAAGHFSDIYIAGSTLHDNGQTTNAHGPNGRLISLGNNSVHDIPIFDVTYPLQ